MSNQDISCIVVQMRLGSSRLPNKMIKDLCGYAVADWVAEGVQRSKADKIVYALPVSDEGSELHDILRSHLDEDRVSIVFGDEENVFSRFKKALLHIKEQYENQPIRLVRVCGDRPLVNEKNLDILLSREKSGLFYNHINERGSGFGFGAELLSADLTDSLFFGAMQKYAHSEHVTKNLYSLRSIHRACFWAEDVADKIEKYNLSKLDLDTTSDFENLREVIMNYSLSPMKRLPI